jgi:hypothetical protein
VTQRWFYSRRATLNSKGEIVAHPFVIGEMYANRKGKYEVASIDDQAGKMLVRYLESGEDQAVSIEIQARIWTNMQLDAQAEARRVGEEEARYQRGYGAAFTGLEMGDFKVSTEGTTWRSRAGLAGQVALEASESTPYTFVSWSIYRWPVAFLTHREDYAMAAFEMGSRKAKFTLEVDDDHLYYGFYVEKGDTPMDHVWDWPRLIRALKTGEALQRTVIAAESEHGARLVGRMSKGDKHFHFANGLQMGAQSLWDEGQQSGLSVKERVAQLESIPDDYWGEIYVIAQMPKQDAIDLGLDIVKPIAGLFKALLPVYKAAVR